METQDRAFLTNCIAFTRLLRQAGIPVGLDQVIEFSRALVWIDLGSREQVYYTARCLLVRRYEHLRLFDTIFIMTGGGPGTQTYTASYYLYTVGFTQFHLSQATAGSWLFLIITALVVTFLVRRLLRVEKT